MTRPTRNRPTSLFAATAADLPLFSGTCQRAEAQQYTPREVAQQASMFDRREHIQKPVKREGTFKNGDSYYGDKFQEDGRWWFVAEDAQGNPYETAEEPKVYLFDFTMPRLAEGTTEAEAKRQLSALAPETNTEARQQADDVTEVTEAEYNAIVDRLQAALPDADRKIRTALIAACNGSVWNVWQQLSGDHNASKRQAVMTVITGTKLPKAKCGVSVIVKHLCALSGRDSYELPEWINA